MTGFAAINSEEHSTHPRKIVSIAGPCTIRRLEALRKRSIPELDIVIKEISQATRLRSEYNNKTNRTAQAKIRRPHMATTKPWMTLAHLRDYLRFRTYLNRIDDFLAVLNVFVAMEGGKKLSIVKVDTVKLLNPAEFGWRMVAIDIRLPSGLLVEHYMTFGDLIHVNNDWLHAVYERWRDQPITNFGSARRRRRDAEFCTLANRELFIARLLTENPMFAIPGLHRQNLDMAINRLVSRHLDL